MPRTNTPWTGTIASAVLIGGSAVASTVTLPHVFTPNTPAKADEVNANFAAVKAAVDDTQAQVSALSGAKVPSSVFKDATGKTVGPAVGSSAVYFDAQGTYRVMDEDTGQPSPLKVVAGNFTTANCTGTEYVLQERGYGMGVLIHDAATGTDGYYTVSRTVVATKLTFQSPNAYGPCVKITQSAAGKPRSAFTPTSVPNPGFAGPLYLAQP